MNTDRIFNAVLMDYTSEQIKLEDKLERTINSNTDIYEKTKEIKRLLNKIVTNESSLLKFKNMVSINNTNNEIESK